MSNLSQSFLNKTKEAFLKTGNTIKKNYEETKKNYVDKRNAIKELDYNELKRIYEKRTGKKAEIVQKDFNTGSIINKRPMTRAELERRIQFSSNVSKENLKKSISKPKSKPKTKPSTINLKV